MRKAGCLIFCLIILFKFGTCAYQENIKSRKNIILSAYSDNIISGAEIYFFADNTMQYESTSLTGTSFYHGTYAIVNDTFFVEYNEDKPQLDFLKMIVDDNDLIFLNPDNDNHYRFNLMLK